MKIIDFTADHIEQAINIAKANYEDEREYVKALPQVDVLPDLKEFAENKLGVAVFEKEKMLGYLCCYEPMENFFGKTAGSFSPIHAHGAIKENRNKIYSKLYQAAAKKWVSKGILGHAIALYAHDDEALGSYFWNGFGLRCVDAIRSLEKISCDKKSKFMFAELTTEERLKILPLKNMLIFHLNQSPMMIPLYQFDEKMLANDFEEKKARIFAAKKGKDIIAYIETMESGENFACDDEAMMNICGAYCMEEYRGAGLFLELLAFMTDIFIVEGYTRLGVDFESFNPTARGFWLKYFTPYTNSVVRRMDERILDLE